MTEFTHGVLVGLFLAFLAGGVLVLMACVWQKRREERAVWRRAMIEAKQRHVARHLAELNEKRVFSRGD